MDRPWLPILLRAVREAATKNGKYMDASRKRYKRTKKRIAIKSCSCTMKDMQTSLAHCLGRETCSSKIVKGVEEEAKENNSWLMENID